MLSPVPSWAKLHRSLIPDVCQCRPAHHVQHGHGQRQVEALRKVDANHDQSGEDRFALHRLGHCLHAHNPSNMMNGLYHGVVYRVDRHVFYKVAIDLKVIHRQAA